MKQLYVGEKARPGRMLILGQITRLVFSIGDTPAGPSSWTTSAWSATTRPRGCGSPDCMPSTSARAPAR